MIFTAPSFLPKVPSPLPLQEPIGEFCIAANLNKTAGEGAPFVEAAIDRSWKTKDIDARVTQLAAALSAAWKLTSGEKWHKTVAILATNSVDILILSWAIHRLGGGCLMLQPTSSADEIAEHLQRIPPFAFFMSDDLLPLGQGALQKIGSVEKLPVYRLQIATKASAASEKIQDVPKLPTLDDLIEEHKDAPHVEKQKWTGNEAAQRVAYYCTTSGTSGFQRIVAITHENMIASILQATSFYQATRDRGSEVTLGFLPFNHIYGLLITHSLMHYGDSVVVHRGFNLMEILMSITRYRINTLYLVPPIINALSRNAAILDKFDLSSVTSIVSGGGPLNQEAFLKMQKARPNWRICSGWGQTESSGIGSLSSPNDICAGSSGILLPGVRIRLRDDEGNIVESLDAMGEIEIASPSVLRGYIDSASDSILPLPADNSEFWWPTGDVGRFGTTPSGATHLWVVDRIRDMIKVKGIQVAPGQIESHLTSHPAVAETAVIGVPNEVAGERALAFVIREPSYKPEMSNTELQKALRDHNDLTLPEVCRLQDRIVIVEQIPKSASGKVLKRELRKQVARSNGQTNGTNKAA